MKRLNQSTHLPLKKTNKQTKNSLLRSPPSSAGEVTVAAATAEATAAEEGEGREETAGARTGGPRREEERQRREVRSKKDAVGDLEFSLGCLVPVAH